VPAFEAVDADTVLHQMWVKYKAKGPAFTGPLKALIIYAVLGLPLIWQASYLLPGEEMISHRRLF